MGAFLILLPPFAAVGDLLYCGSPIGICNFKSSAIANHKGEPKCRLQENFLA